MKNKRTRFCLILLVLLFIVYTISLLFSVRAQLIEYAAAQGTYEYLDNMPDSVSALYFWYGIIANGGAGSGYWFKYFNMIMVLILIPLLLAMVFVDAFVQDFNAGVTDAIIAREGKLRYFANKFLMSFAGPFVTMYVLLIFQFLFGLLMLRVIPTGFQSPGIGMKEIGIVLFTSLKMGFYYGVIMTFSYTLSLVLKRRKTIVYVYPVILVLFFIFLFNPPLHDMSYYYTNLVHENIRFFWGVLITMFIVSSGVQLNALREKSLL
jgi:hypothetical protein